MATMQNVLKFIKSERRKKRSDNSIARDLGINSAWIGLILKGRYPGESVAQRLGIKVKCSLCHRAIPKKTERQPAPKIGRDTGWVEYYMRKIK